MICASWVGPDIILGDLNTIFESNHIEGGVVVSEQEVRDGCEFVMRNNLAFVKSQGHYFSWKNKTQGSDKISSSIDHCIGNSAWMMDYGEVMVEYLNRGFSNHTPLLLEFRDNYVRGGGRPFGFFNYMAQHPQFLAMVEKIWNECPTSSMKQIWTALKAIKREMKVLYTSDFKGIHDRIKQWRDKLEQIQDGLNEDHLNLVLQNEEEEALRQLKY